MSVKYFEVFKEGHCSIITAFLLDRKNDYHSHSYQKHVDVNEQKV